MSDLCFTVSSVGSPSPSALCLSGCPQLQAPVAPRDLEIAIITIVPDILLRGRHCRRSFCARGMNLLTVVATHHPLQRDQVLPLLIVSNIRPTTTRPDCFFCKVRDRMKRNAYMSVNGRGTSHYRRAPEHCLTRAPLVTHHHPVVARTSPGQLQIVHLVRGRIHERCHPASRSVAGLPRKEKRTTSVSVIGGHRVQDGITNIVHRLHQFLNRLSCVRGRKVLTQMV